jgi:hypothetical protein
VHRAVLVTPRSVLPSGQKTGLPVIGGASKFSTAHFPETPPLHRHRKLVDVLRVWHVILSGSMFGKPTKAAILVTLLFWELEEVVWLWALGRYGCTDHWPQVVCFVIVPGIAGAACDVAPLLVTLLMSVAVVMTPGMFNLRWTAISLMAEYLVLYLTLLGPVLVGWGVRRALISPLIAGLRRRTAFHSIDRCRKPLRGHFLKAHFKDPYRKLHDLSSLVESIVIDEDAGYRLYRLTEAAGELSHRGYQVGGPFHLVPLVSIMGYGSDGLRQLRLERFRQTSNVLCRSGDWILQCFFGHH